MTSDPSVNQRRSPRQARSRVTWEAIIEAAAQILERNGAAAFNTASVAERAGVSIGTLYQYFPDKRAILAAAAKRELADGSAAPAARRRALIEALIAMVEGLGGLDAGARSTRSRTAAARRPHREPGWERRCADALDRLVTVLVGRQPALRPIQVRPSPARRPLT